ncbi:hypothetical protein DPQ33_06490 [Oceanidesulfovibrio indonesiensis]|uniref:Cardiolipin synthase N-terminal domain-containing protein n=1 Tax=Oceanidesulfovibrio indonesiensis TaxID=54767 RepID=A0A7M3MGE8_9BACT|nr:PLD nuclease N-terminal domain-containing protein [Oceanidesulfovibrio indonesiensis]TVM18393.1 hypothetical protein DPQ33_06490 [Oceanidesulfovibrio indonesiensis]
MTSNWILTALILALPIIPNLWSIWHIFYRDFPSSTEKLAWLGVAVFIPVIGGVVYILVGRRRAVKPARDH